MQTRYLYLLRLVLIISDFLLLNLTFLGTFYFVDTLHKDLSESVYRHYFLLINMIWLFGAYIFGMYRATTVQKAEEIYRSTWRSIVAHAVIFVFYLAFTKDVEFSRQFLLFFYAGLGGAFILSRFTGTVLEVILKRHIKISKPVAVLGRNKTSVRLAAYFRKNNNNFDFKGFLSEDEALHVDTSGNLLPGTCESIRIAAQRGVKEVYVPLVPERISEAQFLLKEAEKQCVRLKFVPAMEETLNPSFEISYMEGFPVVSLRKEPLEDINNGFKKRIFDIVFSSLVIVFIMSWLVPVIAILIKIQSRGPVFFKQLRSGRDNKSFMCYKFRSMRVNADSDKKQATENDDRITPIGKFLRRSSLDELPQFFNVFLGNMSVVGPRPHMLAHTEMYSKIINQFMVRHFLKPGITGWAQVNGLRGETKDPKKMRKRVEHDIWYMENWSAMLDVKIVFLTVINMIRGEKNAY